MKNEIKQGLNQVGMSFQQELPFEEWKAIGERFGEATKQFSWALGDWLVYGGNKFRKRIPHDLLVEAEKMTGVDRASLMALATVCRRIPIDQRVPNLPFEHHQAISTINNEDSRRSWLSFVAAQENIPSKKLLSLSIRNSQDDPKIITLEDYQKRKIKFGKSTYVTPLRSLMSVLRKNGATMSKEEIQALKADAKPLIDLLESLD